MVYNMGVTQYCRGEYMNINWNRKYLTIAVYATCAVIISAIAVPVV